MIGRTNAEGGGMSLSVKVHASAPAESQSGKEDEIWVVSDTPSQYWAVKTTEPVASDWEEPVIPNGAVWIKDGAASDVPIVVEIAKKAFVIQPELCLQYLDGSWIVTNAYAYKGGIWKQFSYSRSYIIEQGVYAPGISFATHVVGTSDEGTPIVISNGNGYKQFSKRAWDCYSGALSSEVTVGSYRMLCIECDATSNFGGAYFGIYTSNDRNYCNPKNVATKTQLSKDTLIAKVPIGNLSKLRACIISTINAGTTLKVINIWME